MRTLLEPTTVGWEYCDIVDMIDDRGTATYLSRGLANDNGSDEQVNQHRGDFKRCL